MKSVIVKLFHTQQSLLDPRHVTLPDVLLVPDCSSYQSRTPSEL